MQTYLYKAVDADGVKLNGRLEATSEQDLMSRLAKMELDLITCKSADPRRIFAKSGRIQKRDLAMFCQQLQQLYSAGIPILEAFHELKAGCENPVLQRTLGFVITDLEDGKMLSEALAQHPKVFDKVFVAVIAAGESSGKLSIVLQHLFNTLCWQENLISQTKKLLTYPIFVAGVVIATFIFLMTYLVPQMVVFLHSIGQTLPFSTRLLIAISHLMTAHGWVIAAALLAVIFLVHFMVRSSIFVQQRYDALKLSLPIFGPLLTKILLARFARYFAMMYQAGISIMDALKISEDLLGNLVLANSFHRIGLQINAGVSVSESFHNTGLFPRHMIRMIQVGESTGNLDQMLLSMGHFYEQDVNDAIEYILKMLEPTLTILLGVLLAFVMLAVLGPVYDSVGNLGI